MLEKGPAIATTHDGGGGPSEKARPAPVDSSVVHDQVPSAQSFFAALKAKLGESGLDTPQAVDGLAYLKLGEVCLSDAFNPDKKQLTEEQRAALRALLQQSGDDLRPVVEEALHHLQSGFESAVDRGECASTAVPAIAPSMLMEETAMSRIVSQQQDSCAKTIDALAVRFGRPMVDWTYTQVAWCGPDGAMNNTVVYLTKKGHPDYFAARDAMEKRVADRNQAILAFFRGL